ncbi:MAG TPA: hypothetical protein VMU98_05110 [Acidimicrobiales bacterium]|nr:hypothetical protein [Acidimicrobiales bacterium]
MNEVCARRFADVVPDLHQPPPSPETVVPSRQAPFMGHADIVVEQATGA